VTRLTLVLLCAAALLVSACGERRDPTPAAGGTERLDLVLDYFPNADHAGLYAAIDTGAFRDVKLDVRPRVPNDPAAPLRLLESGRVDLAISYEPEVLLARDRGAKIVAIGAIVQKPLTSIVSIGKNPVKRPEDLKGKRVGTAGIPYQDAYLKAILQQADLAESDVRKVDVGFNLTPALISKRVDATLGSFWNYEGVELERRKEKPTILKVDELGVPTYNELVIVAREQDAAKKGAVLRRFMQGLAHGHEAVRADADAGVTPLLAANKDLDRGLQLASVKATLPVFFPSEKDKPFGWMNEDEWLAYGRWMFDNGLLKRQEDPRRALTTEFLPGEGPRPDES
jgi:putative hydroxymethylpyrimidine transport system substrate-binding protein